MLTSAPRTMNPQTATPWIWQREAKRRVTPSAGRALELLGHAIEYLNDEAAKQCFGQHLEQSQLDAIQILKSLNRIVYFECPTRQTLGGRLRKMLHA